VVNISNFPAATFKLLMARLRQLMAKEISTGNEDQVEQV
jgi:hypothetical protein